MEGSRPLGSGPVPALWPSEACFCSWNLFASLQSVPRFQRGNQWDSAVRPSSWGGLRTAFLGDRTGSRTGLGMVYGWVPLGQPPSPGV